MASFSDCYGCSLCLLSCPMWLQRRDIRFSPQGFTTALQLGADLNQMSERLAACIQCGACDQLCPEKIDLSGLIKTGLQKKELIEDRLKLDTTVADCFVMSCDPALLNSLRADDLYIIEASAFNSDHTRRVGHYEKLRQLSGCSMNLDLNRMAVPTGVGSRSEEMGLFDVKKQIAWLIQGRCFQRIIVENPADRPMLAQITGKQVLHVSELIRGVAEDA